MRHIGSLPDESQARLLSDFLVSRGIRNEIEADGDHTWSIWIKDEDQINDARAVFARFHADPHAPEFQNAAEAAAKTRKAEAEDLARYRRRIRSRRSIFPKFGGYGVGILTFTLISVCVFVAVQSKLGENHEWLRRWLISEPLNDSGKVLPEVFNGELWRLFTPIFIHFSPAHIIFNMLGFYQLGCMIEARQGTLYFLALVSVSALLSNLAQFAWNGPLFGGMSGVLYALAGYVWIRGKYDRTSGLYLNPQSIVILLIWLVVCFTGIVGPIGNAAHVAGLVVGMVWGRIAAYFALRKPE